MINYQNFYQVLSTCLITKKIMHDPVIAPDGYCYECSTLKEYLKQHKNITPKGFKVKSYERDYAIDHFTELRHKIQAVEGGDLSHQNFYKYFTSDADEYAVEQPQKADIELRPLKNELKDPVVFNGSVLSLQAARRKALIPHDPNNKVIIKYRQLADAVEYACDWGANSQYIDYWWSGVKLNKLKKEYSEDDDGKNRCTIDKCCDISMRVIIGVPLVASAMMAIFLFIAAVTFPVALIPVFLSSAEADVFANPIAAALHDIHLSNESFERVLPYYMRAMIMACTFAATFSLFYFTDLIKSVPSVFGSQGEYFMVNWSIGFAVLGCALVYMAMASYAGKQELAVSTAEPKLFSVESERVDDASLNNDTTPLLAPTPS